LANVLTKSANIPGTRSADRREDAKRQTGRHHPRIL
jgi:hypothetical protein